MLSISYNKLWLVSALLYASLLPGCARIMPANTKRDSSQSVAKIAEAGFLFESQGRTANAIKCFEKSLAMEPWNKQLQNKISELKSMPEAADSQPAISTLDEVFSRHEKSTRPKFNGKTATTPDQHYKTASHTAVIEPEFDEMFIGQQTLIDSQDSVFEHWAQ